jgi:hypothetical protein
MSPDQEPGTDQAPRLRPQGPRRLSLFLWIAAAVVVWNLVFDRVIIVAGRSYVRAAELAAQAGGPYARIDDSMRPAVGRALVLATAAAAVVLAAGWLIVRRPGRSTSAGSLRRT